MFEEGNCTRKGSAPDPLEVASGGIKGEKKNKNAFSVIGSDDQGRKKLREGKRMVGVHGDERGNVTMVRY